MQYSPCLGRRFALSAVALALSASLLSGCGSLAPDNTSTDSVVAESTYENRGFTRRDLAKASEEVRRLCRLDAKCTPDDADRNVKDLEKIAGDAGNPLQPFVLYENLTTKDVYAAQGDWPAERRKVHETVIKDIFAHATKAADRGEVPLLRLTGGGAGSGKTWCAKRFLQEAQAQSSQNAPVRLALIEADVIKACCIKEYADLSRLRLPSAANQVHVESSLIAEEAVVKAIDEGYDAIKDSTLWNTSYALNQVNQAHAHGVRVHVRGVFVKPETAIARAEKRGERTGRFLPRNVLIRTHKGFSATFQELVKTLDFSKGDHAELYNNDVPENTDPILVYRDGTIVNKTLWDYFLTIKDQDIQ